VFWPVEKDWANIACDDINVPKLLSLLSEYSKNLSTSLLVYRVEIAEIDSDLVLDGRSSIKISPRVQQILDEVGIKRGRLLTSANLLGLLQKDPDEWFKGEEDTTATDALVAEYDSVRAEAMTAKAAGDKAAMGAAFARSDELRDQFKTDGIILETGEQGSTWRKA